ncbi:hypothetical protein ACOMHN_056215 [Nucella lapillus]
MAASATKLGVALLVTLTSNATLLSLLLSARNPPPSPSYSSSSFSASSTDDPATTTSPSKSSSSSLDDDVLSDNVLKRKLILSLSESGGGISSINSAKFPSNGFLSRNFNNGKLHKSGDSLPRQHSGGGKRRVEGRKRVRSRSVRSTLRRIDTGHHLEDVIASLMDSELESMGASTVKILVPALIGLESMVLRELEKLHDASVHQELRLERLEKSQLHQQEIMAAANVLREEEYLLQRQKQQEALREQEQRTVNPQDITTTSTPSLPEAVTTVMDFNEVDNFTSSDLEDGGDGSGSGDESMPMGATAVSSLPPTSAVNNTDSSESAIINHIYEIYSSLSSLEHKVVELDSSLSVVSTELYRQQRVTVVVELDSSLSVVSSELYRQRATVVAVEDKVEELRRNQRSLAMKSTIHGFKLTDLEQFRGQAELLMRTAKGAIEQFDAKLDIFKDRVTEQQDEVQLMRNVFSRLEQSNNELRAADTYKAHDIQELKRGAQQVQTRLNNLYYSLDRYVGNIRWDIKTYLDHVCSSNNLNC